MTDLVSEVVSHHQRKLVEVKNRARLAEVGNVIRERYGALSDSDVLFVDAAERELAECQGCTGYPCRKQKLAGFQPVITVNKNIGAYVTLKFCKPYEERERLDAFKAKLRAAKIPPRYRGKTLADYTVDADNNNAVYFAKTALLKNYGGAFFYGDVGAGKTFLASIIAQDFLRAGKSVLFEKVADLLTEFHEIYRGHSQQSEKELLTKLYNVDLLVLDDFGMEKATKFVGTTLCKILDARYDREGITTIITSNLSIEQVKKSLNTPTDADKGDLCLNGTRIADRCVEFCKTILFKATSRRR